jgi:glycosyltransferase involved in cell wall biosynthesis
LQHGLSPLAAHVIRVRRLGDGCELPGSPRLLEPREGTTLTRASELRLLLRAAAHASADGLDELLRCLQDGMDEVRQIQTQRQSAPRGKVMPLLARVNARTKQTRRALVIDDRMPDPTRDAGSNAIVGHMRALIALGYAVEFVPAKLTADAPPRLPELDAVHWHQAPGVASVEEVLRRNAGAYELIYLHRLSNAAAYAGLARQWCPLAQLAYSVADLHHLRLARQARVLGLPKLMAQARALKQTELVAMRTADAVITHSPAEAEYVAREAPSARVHVVGWPVDLKPSNTSFAARTGVAFIGSVGHEPNRDAALWLVEEIMPRVWQHDPTLVCEIIGADWPGIFKDRLDHRIWLTGRVPDLATVFDRVRLTVAPLRFGAGIKGKVLESFAAGVPCVMTSIAAEGLPLTGDLRRLVGDTSNKLAELICSLHAGSLHDEAIATAGHNMVAQAFSFARVVADMRPAIAAPSAKNAPETPACRGSDATRSNGVRPRLVTADRA